MKQKTILSVITPTIGTDKLARCIESVQKQTTMCIEHYIVIDGPQYEKKVKKIIKQSAQNKKIHSITLAYNVGANNWNGHKTYGSLPYLCNTDLVAYLDEDNWVEKKHYEDLIKAIVENRVDFSHSLRNIYNEQGDFVCKDNCENLGGFHHSILHKKDFFIDTSCYVLKRILAIEISKFWNKKARSITGSPDRDISNILIKHFSYASIGNYSLNYSVGNREDSVQSNFFLTGNHKMRKLLKSKKETLFPWDNTTKINYHKKKKYNLLNFLTLK